VGGNINVILFNNGSFGWIKAEVSLSMGAQYSDFATNFEDIDYPKVAEGFGLTTYRVEDPSELGPTLKEAFGLDGPTFTEVKVLPESELVPPVPGWMEKARRLGVRQIL
jgi:acetolactate synthase-1/2/3 large subunit